ALLRRWSWFESTSGYFLSRPVDLWHFFLEEILTLSRNSFGAGMSDGGGRSMRLTSEAETWRRTTRMTARALEGLAELPRDERDGPGVPLEEIELMKTATRPGSPPVNGESAAPAPASLADDLLRVMSVLVSHAVSRDERADNELALEGVLALTAAVDEMREQL